MVEQRLRLKNLEVLIEECLKAETKPVKIKARAQISLCKSKAFINVN